MTLMLRSVVTGCDDCGFTIARSAQPSAESLCMTANSPLPLRPLGRSGLHIAPLAIGGHGLGWTADRATSLALPDAGAGAGFKLIDTADVYLRWVPGHSGGESESLIGQGLAAGGAARRDRVLIATPAQVALAWQIARPGLTAICSASRTAQWAELAGAARLALDAATIAALDAASAESPV